MSDIVSTFNLVLEAMINEIIPLQNKRYMIKISPHTTWCRNSMWRITQVLNITQSISKFTNKELVSIKYKGMVKPT